MYEQELKAFKPIEKCKRMPKPTKYKSKGELYDDNIYTFDIETISLYEINGEFVPFDYTKDASYYKQHDKVACCYMWQVCLNGVCYYGRELDDFDEVLTRLSDSRITKYIYIHNLEYETQWLLDIFIRNKYHVSEVCARQKRQPIQYKIDELNIVFRCSYQLTNLSLAKASEKYTTLQKATGELDYNIPYSPNSKLPNNAMYYCMMDVLTLYHIILYFRDLYRHIKSIPLTQTGCVRKSLQKECGFFYIKAQQAKVPPLIIYEALTMAFCGGIAHGNILHINKVYCNVWSFDFCSSYPYVMTCYKLPKAPFRRITKKLADKFIKEDSHAILYQVTLTNVKSKYYNHYIPIYKMANKKGDIVADNGRLAKFTGSFDMVLTDYDLKMIKKCYHIGKIKYHNIWASYKDYLEPEAIKFIIQRYADKTTLKGVEGQEEFYQKQKQEINACFGMSAQNVLKFGIIFNPMFDESKDEKMWDVEKLTEEYLQSKLDDMKSSYSTLFFPMACACWITAIARTNLFNNIIKLDHDVIYYDTDSIKGTGDAVYQVVNDYNKSVEEKIKESSKVNKIPIELYKPKDIKGFMHPIGYFENETENGLYKRFKTLGSKKYMYETPDGEKHLTMSGVRKSAVKYLTFETFCNGTVLSYEATGKLIRYYNDDQPSFEYTDNEGNIYKCNQKHTIILQPTTFKIGQKEEFLRLIADYEGYISEF